MQRTSLVRALAWTPAVFFASTLSAQSSALFGESDVVSPAALAELRSTLDTTSVTLQQLQLPETAGSVFQFEVDFGGRRELLVVWPHSVRTPDFQLLVEDADGVLVDTVPAPVATYRGEVVGTPGSIVAGSLFEGQFEGLVRFARDDQWSIQPASRYADGFAPSAHAVHAGIDAILRDGHCGTDTTDAPPLGPAPTPPPPGSPTILYEIELACDADTQFYNSKGSSVAATQADIENIVNSSAAIYEADIAATIVVPAILVRTSEPDPYTTSNAGALLGELGIQWASSHANISRDLAHLFTGKNLQGSTIGIAHLGGLCSSNFGFALSQSNFSSNFSFRVAVTAHEVAHNCSAGHCQNANQCKIMCPSVNGCDGDVTTFAPTSVNKLTNTLSVLGCVSSGAGGPTGPPVITAVLPAQIDAIVPGKAETVNVVGSNLNAGGQVRVDGQVLPLLGGLTFQSEGLITFAMPAVATLGTVDVEYIGGALGDASSTIEVVPASPPALELGEGNELELLFSLLPITLQVAGQPDNIMLTWASLDPSPSAFPGLFDLEIGGFTNLVLINATTVEAKGWTQIQLNPIGVPFAQVYFQSVEYDPLTGALPLEATNVRTGQWVF